MADVRCAAAGEAHTLVVTDGGRLAAWGRGGFGRLGTGVSEDAALPRLVALRSPAPERRPPAVSPPPPGLEAAAEEEECVVAAAAGAYHGLALTGKQPPHEHQWLHSFYGQLGGGEQDSPYSIPNPVQFIEAGQDAHIAAVAAGAIDADGGLWLWGRCPAPVQPPPLGSLHCQREAENAAEDSSRAGSGEQIATACDNQEALSSCTDASRQLVDGVERTLIVEVLQTINIPKRLWLPLSTTILAVACGSEHVLATMTVLPSRAVPADFSLTDGKHGAMPVELYAWGSNQHGQLGLGDTANQSTPQRVLELCMPAFGQVVTFACGAFHSVVVTGPAKSSADTLLAGPSTPDAAAPQPAGGSRGSVCWTFGLGSDGQLGLGTSASQAQPRQVQGLPREEPIAAVACGLFHSCVVVGGGAVFAWGMAGGLGLCPDLGPPGADAGPAFVPVRVPLPYEWGPVQSITCGAAHTVAVCDEGRTLLAWGRNQSGELGNGTCLDSYLPQRVAWPQPQGASCLNFSEAVRNKVNPESAPAAQAADAGRLEKAVAALTRELEELSSHLSMQQRQLATMQAALFGKPVDGGPALLEDWARSLRAASVVDLAKLQAFYQNMARQVDDEILDRKVRGLCQRHLADRLPLATTSALPPELLPTISPSRASPSATPLGTTGSALDRSPASFQQSGFPPNTPMNPMLGRTGPGFIKISRCPFSPSMVVGQGWARARPGANAAFRPAWCAPCGGPSKAAQALSLNEDLASTCAEQVTTFGCNDWVGWVEQEGKSPSSPIFKARLQALHHIHNIGQGDGERCGLSAVAIEQKVVKLADCGKEVEDAIVVATRSELQDSSGGREVEHVGQRGAVDAQEEPRPPKQTPRMLHRSSEANLDAMGRDNLG
eukprot:SM000010S04382  [mRNA]  locus=s10:1260871:1266215:+ [translate_table: standard]